MPSAGDAQKQRGLRRHGFEGGTVGAIVAFAIAKMPEAWFASPYEIAAATAVGVGILGALAKFWHENGLTKRILSRVLPAAMLVFLVGCTGVMGKVQPVALTGPAGETIVACEFVGIGWAGGDGAGICPVEDGYVSTVEGGDISETFKDFGLGIVEAAGRIVAGLFGGIGAAFSGIGSAAAPSDG